MKYQILLFLSTLFVSVFCEDDHDSARLLISKQILNKYLVENMDIIIKVNKDII